MFKQISPQQKKGSEKMEKTNKKKHFTSRKIARSMAKFRMRRAGVHRINHPSSRGVMSPFARSWREWVF